MTTENKPAAQASDEPMPCAYFMTSQQLADDGMECRALASRRQSQHKTKKGTKMELAEKILETLVERLSKPVLPVSVDLWDTKHIGAYLKRSVDNVRKEIVCLPSFPRPVRLPVHGKAQALYKAREVIKWAESYIA